MGLEMAMPKKSASTEKSLRILYVTCCDNGLYVLKNLQKEGFSIAYVVTIAKEVADKYTVSGYVDVAPFCEKHKISCLVLNSYTFSLNNIQETDFDIVVVNGWNRLIPQDIIDKAPLGGIGIHAGHPPIGHGRSPLVWNIIKGMRDLEVYCFSLTKHADNGDILALHPVEITPHDNAQTLYEKVTYGASSLFKEAIYKKANGIKGMPQALSHAEFYPKRTPDDGKINWAMPVHELFNFIRAQSHPYPGAFSTYNGKRVYIDKAIPFDTFSFRDTQRIPGTILLSLPSGLVIQTGTEPLWILDATVLEGDAKKKLFDMSLEERDHYVGKVLT
jgi:methionyl-tRNA formyltransferase